MTDDLTLFVGGPYHGQTMHVQVVGRTLQVQVHPTQAQLADPYGPRGVFAPAWNGAPDLGYETCFYELSHAVRFFPNWRSITGGRLRQVALAPDVQRMGMVYRYTQAQPQCPYSDDVAEAYWQRRRDYEDERTQYRLWESHHQFPLVSEVLRDESTDDVWGYPGGTVRLEWLATVTPEAQQRARQAQEAYDRANVYLSPPPMSDKGAQELRDLLTRANAKTTTNDTAAGEEETK